MSTKNCHAIHEKLVREGSSYTLEDIKDGIDRLQQVPNCLIVINIPSSIFDNNSLKTEFESIFKEFDRNCRFVYLHGFHRAKISMKSNEAALLAKIRANEIFCAPSGTGGGGLWTAIDNVGKKGSVNERIECLFANVPSEGVIDYLPLPQKEKQFLISPPASPPDDWEPKREATPALNYDLLAAIASLSPGESHEIQAPESGHPGIMITPSFNKDEMNLNEGRQDSISPKLKILQTRCPERK